MSDDWDKTFDNEDDVFAFSDSDDESDDEPDTMEDIAQMQLVSEEAQKNADRASTGTMATMFTVGGIVVAVVIWFILHVVKHV